MAFSNPLIRLVQDHPEMQKELGAAAVLKARNGDYDEAEQIFTALAAIDTENHSITLNRAVLLDQKADALRHAGRTDDADSCDDKALKFYKQAMDAEPPLADAFFNAGFYYLKKFNYTRAKDCFETYIALAADTKPSRTKSEENEDPNLEYKLNRAALMVNSIAEHNLNDDEFRLAYEYINKGEEEIGVGHIQTFLRGNPTVWNAWFLLGWGLRRMEKWQEAREAFELAIKHGESSKANLVDTYNEMAICCLELKQYKEAEKYLYRAISLEGENTKVMSNMGCVCLKQGKTDEALSWFSTVLEFNPDDDLARQMVEDLS
jgi:tetratricopeptide (TPR) repeat protein